MKKIVLTFGLIAGAILSAVMLAVTVPFHDEMGLNAGFVVGYASMVLGFMSIFFGVRAYRDTVNGGTVRFGRALAVGLLIGAVGCACYTVTWEVVFFGFKPDFMTSYNAQVLEKERARGATAEQIAHKKAEMDQFAAMYRNPAINAAMTFAEPLPVALLMALVSAGVLSRRKRVAPQNEVIASPQASASSA